MNTHNMIQNKYLVILFLLLFVPTHQSFAKRSAAREIKVPEGLTYEVLQYREGEHPRAGQMAISYKDDGVKDKPVVVFIHGGGWSGQDKDAETYHIFDVAEKGFVGVTISYRLISEAPFPTCIEDVKEAIRYLKSQQANLPIDINRIGVWGYSAGAHLASMVALTPEDAFNSKAYSNFNSNVKAAMVVSTPTDIFASMKKGLLPKNILSNEQIGDVEFLKQVSPLYNIHASQIPIFMLHGTKDPLVKPYNYLNFAEKVKAKNINNFELFEFEGGDHSFYWKMKQKVKPVFQKFLNSL